jgi:hypothetical protein
MSHKPHSVTWGPYTMSPGATVWAWDYSPNLKVRERQDCCTSKGDGRMEGYHGWGVEDDIFSMRLREKAFSEW